MKYVRNEAHEWRKEKIRPEHVAIVQTFRAKRIQFHKYVLIIIGNGFDHIFSLLYFRNSFALPQCVFCRWTLHSTPSLFLYCLYLLNHK